MSTSILDHGPSDPDRVPLTPHEAKEFCQTRMESALAHYRSAAAGLLHVDPREIDWPMVERNLDSACSFLIEASSAAEEQRELLEEAALPPTGDIPVVLSDPFNLMGRDAAEKGGEA